MHSTDAIIHSLCVFEQNWYDYGFIGRAKTDAMY